MPYNRCSGCIQHLKEKCSGGAFDPERKKALIDCIGSEGVKPSRHQCGIQSVRSVFLRLLHDKINAAPGRVLLSTWHYGCHEREPPTAVLLYFSAKEWQRRWTRWEPRLWKSCDSPGVKVSHPFFLLRCKITGSRPIVDYFRAYSVYFNLIFNVTFWSCVDLIQNIDWMICNDWYVVLDLKCFVFSNIQPYMRLIDFLSCNITFF